MSTTSCPVSHVTAESQTLLEEFYAWKLLGTSDYNQMPARVAEAIFILENETILENTTRTERDSAN